MRVTLNETSQAKWREDNAEELRYQYDLKPQDVVFDIGSYHGEWSAEIYRRYQCRIIGVEPTPYNAFQHFERFINEAASDRQGRMHFGGAYYYSSAHEDPAQTYPCFDINPLMEQYQEIALCKVNIEGGEYELLPHIMGAGLHHRIKNLQIQFHEIEGEPFQERYEAIAAKLCATHAASFFYQHCWENWRRRDA